MMPFLFILKVTFWKINPYIKFYSWFWYIWVFPLVFFIRTNLEENRSSEFPQIYSKDNLRAISVLVSYNVKRFSKHLRMEMPKDWKLLALTKFSDCYKKSLATS